MKLTKPVALLLEKAFSAEIEGALGVGLPIAGLPKSKVLDRALREDLLRPDSITVGGHPPARFEGFSLTHRGRLLYCTWASEQTNGATT